MTIREELEWTEHLCLSERAQFSDATRGRPRPEEPQENDVPDLLSAGLRSHSAQ